MQFTGWGLLREQTTGMLTGAKRHAGLLCLLLSFSAAVHGEVRVLKGFTLIDGTGRPAAPNSAMIVDNGRITWVGKAADLKAPAGAETVDLTGKFVMPGIINL